MCCSKPGGVAPNSSLWRHFRYPKLQFNRSLQFAPASTLVGFLYELQPRIAMPPVKPYQFHCTQSWNQPWNEDSWYILSFFPTQPQPIKITWNPNTPWKINMVHLQITHLERKIIFQTSMIMFHVNLQGCRRFGRFFLLSRGMKIQLPAGKIFTGSTWLNS